MFELPDAPQPIGKVLDTAFQLYRTCFKAVLPLAAVYAILGQLPSIVSSRALGTTTENVSGSMVTLVSLFAIVCFVVSLGLYVALLHAIDRIAHSEHPPLGDSLAYGLRRLLTVLGAAFLGGLAIIGGMMLLIVPGIILMVTLFFATAAIATEDRGAVEALKRSHRLVWGNWWRTAAELTVIGLIFMIPFFLVGAVVGGIVGATGTASGQGGGLAVDVAMIVVQAVLGPLLAAGYLAIFYDRRLRKEGADLEARLSAQA